MKISFYLGNKSTLSFYIAALVDDEDTESQ